MAGLGSRGQTLVLAWFAFRAGYGWQDVRSDSGRIDQERKQGGATYFGETLELLCR